MDMDVFIYIVLYLSINLFLNIRVNDCSDVGVLRRAFLFVYCRCILQMSALVRVGRWTTCPATP